MSGGHHVPIEKIVDRYRRSLANLQVLYQIAHRVYLFDNSVDGVEARLIVRFSDGTVRKIYGPLPDWMAAAQLGIANHPRFEDLRAM